MNNTNQELKFFWVVALRPEANALIKKFNLKSFSNHCNFPIYINRKNGHALVISGVGSIKSAVATMYLNNTFNPGQFVAWINIGIAGGMTRLSTGYTFLNIQEHSKYIRMNIENIGKIKRYEVAKKYQFLDKIFLKVLENNPEKMPSIFFNMFSASSDITIKFLSNKSNIAEDISVILKMPKFTFITALFKR